MTEKREIRITCKGAAMVPLAKLEHFQGNLKTLSKKEYGKLRKTIETAGFSFPIFVWKDKRGKLQIIDGHQRVATVKTMLKDGYNLPRGQVPVAWIEANSRKDALKKVLLAASQYGRYDEDSVYEFISLGGLEFPELKMEIDLPQIHMGKLEQGWFKDDDPAADEVPEPPKVPITKPGDLWEMGDHRLLCGDATNEGDISGLLRGCAPFLCVTDPPYGVNYDPEWRQRVAEEGHLTYGPRRIGAVTNDDRSDWKAAWDLFPGDVLYSWHPPGSLNMVHGAAIEAAGFNLRAQIIWAKPHFPIGRGDYHLRHEPCWYAVRNGRPSKRTDDRSQSTLWEITLDKNVEGGHSTQKPCECMARPIRNHEAADVYDPFVGSGTTVIAAEKLGRRCFAVEVEQKYCDVTVERWENYTGGKAKRIKA